MGAMLEHTASAPEAQPGETLVVPGRDRDSVSAKELFGVIFSKADLEHPGMRLLHSLGLERRKKMLLEGDDLVVREAHRAAGGSGNEKDMPFLRGPRPIEPPDPEISAPLAGYRTFLEIMEAGSDANRLLNAVHDSTVRKPLAVLFSAGVMGPARPLRTIREAVSYISPVRVCQAAMILELLLELDSEPYCGKTDFLAHSLWTGVYAGLIARRQRFRGPDDYFLAGLAHDLGRLVLAVNRPKEAACTLARAGSREILLTEAEFSCSGFIHATQGSVVLRGWPVPLKNLDAVLNHHVPDFSASPLAGGVVHLADIMSHALAKGLSGEKYVPPLSDEAWRRLGLTPRRLRDVVETGEALMKGVCLDSWQPSGTADTPEPFEFY